MLNIRTISAVVAVGLAAIYLTYIWRLDDKAHWGMSLIFGAAILSLLWDKDITIPKPQPAAIGLGAAIIAMVLALSLQMADGETFVRLMPLLCGFGIAFIVAGFQGLSVYRNELTLLFFLSVPRVIFSLIQDISPITARFSAFLLWYIGYDPQVEGVLLKLEGQAIRVWEGCSGAESICYMLGIAVVCLMLYPIQGRALKIAAVGIAAFLGFVINAVRVALLAVLVMKNNIDAFTYWHEGNGSLVFGTGSVALFGLLYWLASNQLFPENPVSSPE